MTAPRLRPVPVAPPAEPMLVMDAVSLGYERRDGTRVEALRSLSLAVERHSFVALLGPSGCGKTTVLRLAGGLLSPEAGRVEVEGRAAVPGPHTGFVFQNFRLIPWATVRANVEFALAALPPPERRERAERYLELVGLRRVADRYPGQLSGGMQQRVALARALAPEPGMLLMDEPFASLDAQTRELMQGELTRIWMRGRPTVLFVTHSVDEALLLADRIVLMGEGRILEDEAVDLPRPRRSTETRAEPRFMELRARLWDRIRDLVLSDPSSEFHGRRFDD